MAGFGKIYLLIFSKYWSQYWKFKQSGVSGGTVVVWNVCENETVVLFASSSDFQRNKAARVLSAPLRLGIDHFPENSILHSGFQPIYSTKDSCLVT